MSDLEFVDFDPSKVTIPKWAWKGRILWGGLNLLVGNEGVGKGMLASWILAQLSTASLPGCFGNRPIHCAVIASEDDFHSVWGPRIMACGGDMKYIHAFRNKSLESIDFSTDLEGTLRAFKNRKIRFVYIDQLQDHLPLVADAYKSQHVRAVLVPVHHALRDTGITGLSTLHPNKKGSTFREIVTGSSAFLQVPRTAMYVALNPADPNRRVLVTRKNNYGPLASAREFEIESALVRPNGRNVPTARIKGMTESAVTFEDLMVQPTRHVSLAMKVEDAVRLSLAGGEWHLYQRLMESDALKQLAPNRKMMDRVASRLNVEKRRQEFGGKVEWRLGS